jgi:hypothetical protein
MYILLVNNVVVQKQPNDEEGFVWTDQEVVCGQIEKDGVFTTPKPTKANAQAEINQENLAYLDSTDWYVIRNADSGEAVPIEISEARAAARLLIVE